MTSIFTKIVEGKIPAYKIAESKDFLAFLDINPLMRGHSLVIPKKEVDYLFDLDDKLYRGLMEFSRQVAKGIEKSIDCSRIGLVVMGLEVPHAHIHLIPMRSMDDMNFANPKLNLDRDEMEKIAEKIKVHLRGLDGFSLK